MKRLFLILLTLINCTFTYAQSDLVVVSNSRYLVMYRNVPNHVQLAFAGMNDAPYSIVGYGCELSNTNEAGELLPAHNFILRSTEPETRYGILKVVRTKDSVSVDTIATFDFYWRTLPGPSLYLGSSEPNQYFNPIETKLFAKYGPDIFLDNTFTILNWQALVGEKVYQGTGNELSQEYLNAIKKIKAKEKITISVKVMGEDRITRMIAAEFYKSPE